MYKGSGVFRSSGCRALARDLKRATNMYATTTRRIVHHLATPCHPVEDNKPYGYNSIHSLSYPFPYLTEQTILLCFVYLLFRSRY